MVGDAGPDRAEPKEFRIAEVSRYGKTARFAVFDEREYIQHHHAEGVFYEEELLNELYRLLQPGDVVVDVGANIGNHTIFFAAICGCRVVALEPDPDNFRHLQQNVALNDFGEQVTLLQVGAGETSGGFARIASRDPANSGATRLELAPSETAISVVRLDDVPLPGPPRLIKVDTEGMDLAVLRGAAGLLSRHDPLIAVEAQTYEGFVAVAEWLERFSYVCSSGHNYTPAFMFAKQELGEREAELVRAISRSMARAHIRRHDRVSELDLRMREAWKTIRGQKEELLEAEAAKRQHRQEQERFERDTRALTEKLKEAARVERELRTACHGRDDIIRRLARRLGRLEGSTSLRVGRLVVRAFRRPYLLPVLPFLLAWVLLKAAVRKLRRRGGERPGGAAGLSLDLPPLPASPGAVTDGAGAPRAAAAPRVDVAAEMESQFSGFLRKFLEEAVLPSRGPLTVISSTTKRIGEANRANRPMVFAQELAEMGMPVIYVYYRFRPTEDFIEYPGGRLLQLPNDLLHRWAGDIAAWEMRGDKVFLCGIADLPSVSEVGLFRYWGWRVVYDVRDDWEEFHRAGVGQWYDRAYERFLCRQADVVTAVSVTLREKMLALGARPEATHLVPNATSGSFISNARASFERRRGGDRGRGVVGYFGHLTPKWFNWDLLLRTASRRQDLRFEIIGYGAPEELVLPANVQFLGSKTHEEIIRLSSEWSAAIIPFANGKLAEAVDPIKIYEYLALGLPCVSCWMPQIESYPLAFTYRRDGDFESALDSALSFRPSEEQWARTAAFVAGSTWRGRVREVLRLAGVSAPGEATRGQ